MPTSALAGRASYSKARLSALRERIQRLDSLREAGDICIYTTGSYGRLEASSESDLDIFFAVNPDGEPPTRLAEILLDADLIRLTRELGFPDFSGDGEYLQVHRLKNMERHLGGPRDDFDNFFTARLLLLLESQPLANDEAYSQALSVVADWYFRDYSDHINDFRPVFLANDIIRFWKTLCLNYENKRNEMVSDEAQKGKHRLKNLKLKYSRMVTCFSTLIAIGSQPGLTSEGLTDLTRLTPWQRLDAAAQSTTARTLLNDLEAKYDWFLQFTARPKEEQLSQLTDPKVRTDILSMADTFGNSMYSLLVECVSDKIRRYLIV